MSEDTINLAEWFNRQREWQHRIIKAKEALLTAEDNLKRSDDSIKRIVLKQLDQGQTTGDPLQDEAFRIFGLNKKVLGRLVDFSNLLVQNKDQEMLIAFPYKRQVVFRFSGQYPEYNHIDCFGYIFGTLSGGRLKLSRPSDENSENFEAVIPFERHMIFGFNAGCALKPKMGNLILSGSSFPFPIFGPTVWRFIEQVVQRSGVNIFFGKEVDDRAFRNKRLELAEIRKILHSATPKEQTVSEST